MKLNQHEQTNLHPGLTRLSLSSKVPQPSMAYGAAAIVIRRVHTCVHMCIRVDIFVSAMALHVWE